MMFLLETRNRIHVQLVLTLQVGETEIWIVVNGGIIWLNGCCLEEFIFRANSLLQML